jgi:hypothetical protein
MAKYNVFISWSGSRSLEMAKALRDWLGVVIQVAKPWISDDMDKGSRGFHEIADALNGIKVGISCLTPENLENPWLLYEAGALSKTIDTKTRLCTFLHPSLAAAAVKPPLGIFQWTRTTKEDTRKLLATLESALSEEPRPETQLDEIHEMAWPKLANQLSKISGLEPPEPTLPSNEDMLLEILEWTRAQTRESSAMTLANSLADQFAPIRQRAIDPLAYRILSMTPNASLEAKSILDALRTSFRQRHDPQLNEGEKEAE